MDTQQEGREPIFLSGGDSFPSFVDNTGIMDLDSCWSSDCVLGLAITVHPIMIITNSTCIGKFTKYSILEIEIGVRKLVFSL